MFEELDLKIGDEEHNAAPAYITVYTCRVGTRVCYQTNSGGGGTSCRFCC